MTIYLHKVFRSKKKMLRKALENLDVFDVPPSKCMLPAQWLLRERFYYALASYSSRISKLTHIGTTFLTKVYYE